MAGSYFDRVRALSGSRFWVNNPTIAETAAALEAGAMGCTTNPAFGGNLVRRAPDEVLPIVRDAMAESDDDRVVAEAVQERLVRRIAHAFLPLHERTDGHEGFVSIQGSPTLDGNGGEILREALAGRAIAPNVCPKIPATEPGLHAFETLVASGSPVIVTEVFSLSQLVEVCERWLIITRRTGVRPPFFISPITGILGDHLKRRAAQDGLVVPAEAMDHAGIVLARRCFAVVRERDYPVTLLYGGARTRLDFTGLVGGAMAATINWSTAAELLAADPEVSETVHDAVEHGVERLLSEAFPEMRAALDPDGLEVVEFESFGPVQHFRDNFVAGWDAVLAMIAAERGTAAASSHHQG